MARMVWIDRNARPPDGEDWVLIVRDEASGRYFAEGSKQTGPKEATFYNPSPASELELETAVEKAGAWADAYGVSTIYIRDRRQARR